MPFSPGVSTTLRAERLEQPPAFERHGLRHRHDELVAACRTGERQADAGVAAGRLDDRRVRFDLPGFLGGIDHRHADAVLDRPERIEVLELGRHCRLGIALCTLHFHERRVPNALREVIVNSATEGEGVRSH